MDIFAHGLWSGAVAKAVNRKKPGTLEIKKFVFWGIFPDMLSFTVITVWIVFGILFGGLHISDFQHSAFSEPVMANGHVLITLTHVLYSVSHSLPVFVLVFGLTFLAFRRPAWEIFGWLFHVLIDIPTHSYKFFATPFLWPLSDFRFDGYSWNSFWFLAVNYFSIALVYYLLRERKESKNN